jgi:hypothetical protein
MGRFTGSIESGNGERLLIGIDPGSITGVSIVKISPRQIKSLITTNFWELFNLLNLQKDTLAQISQIHIEQPSMVKSLYARHGKRLEELQSKIQTRDKIVWNSAENAREGILLRDGLRNLGYTCFDCRPVGRKKWTSQEFQAATGYQDHSNQHVRDATFLVWDKVWKEEGQL